MELTDISANNPGIVPRSALAGADFVLHTPATNDEKHLLTGLDAGNYALITSEGGRVEQFIPTVPTLVVVGGSQDGQYSRRGAFSGKPYYVFAGQADSGAGCSYSLYWNMGWQLIDNDHGPLYYNSADTPEPPNSGWINATNGSPAAITVARSDQANDANWPVLRNTVLAYVNNLSGIDLVLDQNLCSSYAVTLAWLCADGVTATCANGDPFDENFASYNARSSGASSYSSSPALCSPFPIPIPCAPRDQHVYLFIYTSG